MTDPTRITLADAQPFLKWAGGKGQLLAQYDRFFPRKRGGTYFEPFVGSGAVFFELRKRGLFDTYHLSDVNPELVNCFTVVRDCVDDLIAALREHKARHDEDAPRITTPCATWTATAWAATNVERAARMTST